MAQGESTGDVARNHIIRILVKVLEVLFSKQYRTIGENGQRSDIVFV